jgi:hypothetical protein
MNNAILKVYLFFLVQYFNDYISRYKDMLEKKNKEKAIQISYNNISSISIRQLNNRGSTIQENYEPYKLCIIFL